ncbi:hypothetical protein JOB18_042809 [Solea senegalensis]|uniref:Uncharacterized protein n=1 Tax=Solea senegalensis TaxID=28829 RepID=A0AAV6S8B5_SOLSE|nr:hypothetical protein JOB18_042809 [Solea senegalensis]
MDLLCLHHSLLSLSITSIQLTFFGTVSTHIVDGRLKIGVPPSLAIYSIPSEICIPLSASLSLLRPPHPPEEQLQTMKVVQKEQRPHNAQPVCYACLSLSVDRRPALVLSWGSPGAKREWVSEWSLCPYMHSAGPALPTLLIAGDVLDSVQLTSKGKFDSSLSKRGTSGEKRHTC